MDARQFDALTRAISSPGLRRRLLGLLAAIPILPGLLALLSLDDTAAKDRRRRRKRRHKRRKGKRKGKGKQGCKPQGKGKVCAGKCGAVKGRHTCGKTVDCGSCDCNPACAECFTCQGAAGAPGTCAPQPGAPCGNAATCHDGVLQPQGACDGSGVCEAAGPVSCAPYAHCDGNACATTCSDDLDCVAESYCLSGECVGDGANGDPCVHDGQCQSGHCVEQVCCDTACTGECVACNLPGDEGACTPRPVDTRCGVATCTDGVLQPQGRCNGAGVCDPADPISCAPYTQCDGNACATTCTGDGDCNDLCCGGTCQECCDSEQCSSITQPVCVAGSCAACSAAPEQCPGGTCCASDGSCAPGTAHDACGSSGTCATCTVAEVCFEQSCCTPTTCEHLGKECGSWPDGCGGALECGTCGAGSTPACNNGTCDTCANTCGSDCTGCLNLVDGATMCSAHAGIDCSKICSSNADCSSGMSCIANIVALATGQVDPVSNICGSPAVCGLAGTCRPA